MTKPLKTGRPTIAVRPSRIRRDPVRLETDPRVAKKVEARTREREMWGGIAGVTLFAVVLAVAAIGISAATLFKDDPAAAAEEAQFNQCYNGGPNCVIDGGTIHVEGEKIRIAGIDAPQIRGAACEQERSRGIDAAVRLAELLNGGKVTLGASVHQTDGSDARKVLVDGQDVAEPMVDAGLARAPGSSDPSWCA